MKGSAGRGAISRCVAGADGDGSRNKSGEKGRGNIRRRKQYRRGQRRVGAVVQRCHADGAIGVIVDVVVVMEAFHDGRRKQHK